MPEVRGRHGAVAGGGNAVTRPARPQYYTYYTVDFLCRGCRQRVQKAVRTCNAPPQFCSRSCFARNVNKGKGRPVQERFWKFVTIGTPDECWPFTGAKRIGGYGAFKVSREGNNIAASRAAWIVTFGEIAPGLFVCHRCDNPPCCNPAHLFLGSDLDNKRDSMQKGRHAFGERSSSAKLTVDQVREIRHLAAAGVNDCELGRRFNMGRSTIRNIRVKNTWKQVAA